ncbi:uncharacterized protein LOC127866089 [Dreissena polymorpha]|uniref:Uncharacterized protein n=1 Tax=Dreissena polymorpha TaxID=45954 RepID=A0A9D4RD21_DREPO|nr:uncharacterized protein LOC127866089 [Dreissena polymorpha]XP_052262438.1 uncharacterized protein LOC127866089 [Dreissena polymorpha]XP_052262439.1 uncharacterized protein LOC127866089 [Dreissena polymorpha]KAH3861900.1 hypothetical protein DPMN_024854 [Dreissena polymorpha]
MQSRPIKSAPASGRLRNRRTNAVHEIEDWVFSNRELVAGKSTEQRLLRARLMELGKERFKMKSKFAHDMQKFIDKQSKIGLFNRSARPASASALETQKQMEKRLVESAPVRRPLSPIPARPKTVQFQTDMARGGYLKTGAATVGDDDKNDALMREFEETFIPLQPNLSTGIPLSVWSRPSTAGNERFGRPDIGYSSGEPNRTSTADINKINTCKNKLPRVTSDPRFSKLQTCLTENYTSNVKCDVATLIQKKESLRVPLRTGSKEARRDLEIKIQLFMKENNIVF